MMASSIWLLCLGPAVLEGFGLTVVLSWPGVVEIVPACTVFLLAYGRLIMAHVVGRKHRRRTEL
jgi:hypothetical protein